MQSHQEYHQIHRPQYGPQSRLPSGLSPSDLSSQAEPQKASQASSSSQIAKLDGVLYHFYTTTANLILQSRLARYRGQFLAKVDDNINRLTQQQLSTDLPTSSKSSKWFALHVPDNELFKEELRFWRSITSLLEKADMQTDGVDVASVAVPDMVIDVILDLEKVPSDHQVMLLPTILSSSSVPKVTAVDSASPKRIVLEQWRVRFEPATPASPPELPTLYRRSIVHFRALFTLLLTLPANKLSAKIESFHKVAASRSSKIPPTPRSYPTLSARKDSGSYDHEMRLGCRLSMGVGVENGEEGEYLIQKPLPVEAGSGPSVEASSHTDERILAPIVTPIGNIILSVKYRKHTDYIIEDADRSLGADTMAVEVDENYFRPSVRHVPPFAVLEDRNNGPGRVEAENTSAPAFLAHPRQQIGGITAERLLHGYGVSTSTPTSHTATSEPGTEVLTSQSAAHSTVFSTAATGRPVAGLSSLRGASSMRANSNVGTGGFLAPGTAPRSPAIAAALDTEPAFVTPGVLRRASASERRLRASDNIVDDGADPSLSPSAGACDLPETGTSLPKNDFNQASALSAKPRSGRLSSGSHTLSGTSASRPSSVFSPSSSSPLASQLSLQGPRIVSSNATALMSRQSSSANMRSLAAESGLTGPSLRSVFQTYARSPAGLTARTSPNASTTAPAHVHGSYSPSVLGTGQRSTSIRRYSSTSDAGSGSALGTSATAAAQPQMIKRYSTNFAYRQNRERQGTYGSSLSSEGSGLVGPGAEPSSYPYARGQGGSLGSSYGRSLLTRMEYRQGQSNTGSNNMKPSNSQDETSSATASPLTRFRNSIATTYTSAGTLTPSPRSQDEEIGAFMHLLNSKPAFGSSTMGRLGGSRGERRSVFALGSTPEENSKTLLTGISGDRFGRVGTPDSFHASPNSSQRLSGHTKDASTGLRSSVYNPIRTAHPLSRSQVDEMLSRMAESVGLVSLSDGATPGLSKSLSHADASRPLLAQEKVLYNRSRADLITPDTGTEHGDGDATLGVGRTRMADPRHLAARAAADQHPSVGLAHTRVLHTIAGTEFSSINTSPSDTTGLGAVANNNQLAERTSTTDSNYDMEGELMFGADQTTFDLEDELPGNMDLMTEEESSKGIARKRVSDTNRTGLHRHDVTFDRRDAGLGEGIEGGRGATLPAGAHRNGGQLHSVQLTEWQRAEQRERERAQEVERRRADAEMSRNFGQEVGASTRGRGSLSPWRASGHGTMTSQAGGTASALSTPSPTATPSSNPLNSTVGFKSSSNRPLMGVGRSGGYSASLTGTDNHARRGYGISAPSTQFHYQHSSPRHSRQSSNSYPASRDEMQDPVAAAGHDNDDEQGDP